MTESVVLHHGEKGGEGGRRRAREVGSADLTRRSIHEAGHPVRREIKRFDDFKNRHGRCHGPLNIPPFSCGRSRKRGGAGSDERARGTSLGARGGDASDELRRSTSVTCSAARATVPREASASVTSAGWCCFTIPCCL